MYSGKIAVPPGGGGIVEVAIHLLIHKKKDRANREVKIK
jgi:hypothetical protein